MPERNFCLNQNPEKSEKRCALPFGRDGADHVRPPRQPSRPCCRTESKVRFYAPPGVHKTINLFDAFQRAGNQISVVHTRHEQGGGSYGAGRYAGDRKAAGVNLLGFHLGPGSAELGVQRC